MANAALLFHPDCYDTAGPRLMGRQSAGESFLRGFLQHADVDAFHFWLSGFKQKSDAVDLVRRNSDTTKPLNWIGYNNLPALRDLGCMYTPQPGNAPEAWRRQPLGSRAYSICGVTHTISSAGVMDVLADMLLAPVEPWDALICTSTAAKAAIQSHLDAVADYLEQRLGTSKRPAITLPVIPLGVKTSDFRPRPGAREAWRERLGIDEAAVAVLYVGRLSFHAKMNPAPMAIAMQRAAVQSGVPLHWIFFGQAPTPGHETAIKDVVRDLAPDVTAHYVDGQDMDARFSIWPAADLFFSLSDNIQETFGLTPLEAMAAGVPSVVSDWDGYRDTVRDGIDGFRIPTRTPRDGMSLDLAYLHAIETDSYDAYIGAASLLTSVDIDAATAALVRLIEQPELRRRMGQAAALRAQEVFDWKHIVPRYQGLWDELALIRTHAPSTAPQIPNPWRPDPFRIFSSFPTAALSHDLLIEVVEGKGVEDAIALLRHPTVSYAASKLPRADQIRAMFDRIGEQSGLSVGALVADFPARARGLIGRSLLTFEKFGVIRLARRGPGPG